MKNSRNQAGFGLIELMLSIGIIAILAVAVVSYFNNVDHQNKVKDEVNNLNTLSGAVRNMFNSQGSYEGLENKVILKSGSFPDRMRVPSKTDQIKNGWLTNGVQMAPVTDSSPNDAYTITYSGIPERACVDIVSNAFRFFEKVTAGSTIVTTIATATTGCVPGDNVIIFQNR